MPTTLPPPDIDMQVKMLYCEYGWDIPKIAATLRQSESLINVSVKHQGLTKKEVDTNTPALLDIITQQTKISETTINLKAEELIKQAQLAPILAVIEVTLLQKILNEAIMANDTATISELVRSFKKLTQDAVINTVVKDENQNAGKPTVAVQVVNKFD